MFRLSLVLAFIAFPALSQGIEETPLPPVELFPSLEDGLEIKGLLTENSDIGFVDTDGNPLPDTQHFGEEVQTETAQQVTEGLGAVIRGLDRVSTHLMDFELASGDHVMFGPLLITLKECRYPPDNPSGEAFAYLTIEDRLAGSIAFEGWMIESSPALSALDHSRYDVWVLSCRTISGEEVAPEE